MRMVEIYGKNAQIYRAPLERVIKQLLKEWGLENLKGIWLMGQSTWGFLHMVLEDVY